MLIIVAIPVIEAILALGLLAQAWPTAFLAGVAILATAFTTVQFVTIQRSLDADCGCFGTETKVSRKTVARAAMLGIIAIGAFIVAYTQDGFFPVGMPQWQTIVQGAVVGCGVLSFMLVVRLSIHAISQAMALKRAIAT